MTRNSSRSLYYGATGNAPDGATNQRVSRELGHLYDRYGDRMPFIKPSDLAIVEDALSGDPLRAVKKYVLEDAEGMDRHACLSLVTRHNTTEFRLWNSTRSAWRMELFCGLSRAWMDPAFVGRLNRKREYAGQHEGNADAIAFQDALASIPGHERTAELFMRQIEFQSDWSSDPVFSS
jgi:hypothetical protein